MMNFDLITIAAAEGLRTQADSVELTQHGLYGAKLNLWVVCRAGRDIFWATWLYL